MNPSCEKWLFIALTVTDITLKVGTHLWPFYNDVLPPDIQGPVHVTLTLTSLAVSLGLKIWSLKADK